MNQARRHACSREGIWAALTGASAISGRVLGCEYSRGANDRNEYMQPPLLPSNGPDYQLVVTLNGWTLAWRMNGDWKEFHPVAWPVVREFAPGMKAYL
jgi:manganese oxidase